MKKTNIRKTLLVLPLLTILALSACNNRGESSSSGETSSSSIPAPTSESTSQIPPSSSITTSSQEETTSSDVVLVTYTLSFDANGGTGTMESIVVDESTEFETLVPECSFTRTGYEFAGWKDSEDNSYQVDKSIELDSDTTLFAQWEKANYLISFLNDDNTVIDTKTDYHYGDTIVIPADPNKASTAQYDYTFAGWDPEVPETVTKSMIFNATYDKTVRSYTIKFMNDETELQKEVLEYGETPEYKGETPTKEPTLEHIYTFTGWDKEIVPVTGEETYTAQFDESVRKYTITWIDGNGDTLKVDQLLAGETPSYTGTPTKTSTAQYSYTFTGWDPEVVDVVGDATYTAQFSENLRSYTIKFMNGENELQKEVLDYGETPTYKGETPTKASTAQYTYEFTGWDLEIVDVVGDATYTAQFDSHVRSYTIKFMNGEDELQSEVLEYGKTPEYKGETPTKEPTLEHVYTFVGWDKTIATVTGEETYKATFSESDRKYTITWIDGDGNTLKVDELLAGETPSYTGTPTKTSTAQYSYTFTGWDPEVVDVVGDATYTAQFSENLRSYTIKFMNGENELQKEVLDYGETPVYKGATPTKDATAQYTYTFAGWSPEIASVTGEVTYIAQFDSHIRSYTIKFMNGEDELQSEVLEYGTLPTYKGATPTKESTIDTTYTFHGWDAPIAYVTGEKTYYATFDDATREYDITWIDGNDQVLTVSKVPYGSVPSYDGATPTRDTDESYHYTFNGQWSPTIEVVTGDASYTALFNATPRYYTITIASSNGDNGKINGQAQIVIDNLLYETAITVNGSVLTIGDTDYTAVETTDDDYYNYSFIDWDGIPEGGKLLESITITANFDATGLYTLWIRASSESVYSKSSATNNPPGDYPGAKAVFSDVTFNNGVSYMVRCGDTQLEGSEETIAISGKYDIVVDSDDKTSSYYKNITHFVRGTVNGVDHEDDDEIGLVIDLSRPADLVGYSYKLPTPIFLKDEDYFTVYYDDGSVDGVWYFDQYNPESPCSITEDGYYQIYIQPSSFGDVNCLKAEMVSGRTVVTKASDSNTQIVYSNFNYADNTVMLVENVSLEVGDVLYLDVGKEYIANRERYYADLILGGEGSAHANFTDNNDSNHCLRVTVAGTYDFYVTKHKKSDSTRTITVKLHPTE